MRSQMLSSLGTTAASTSTCSSTPSKGGAFQGRGPYYGQPNKHIDRVRSQPLLVGTGTSAPIGMQAYQSQEGAERARSFHARYPRSLGPRHSSYWHHAMRSAPSSGSASSPPSRSGSSSISYDIGALTTQLAPLPRFDPFRRRPRALSLSSILQAKPLSTVGERTGGAPAYAGRSRSNSLTHATS